MIRFSLAKSQAVITNINQRLEKNGPDGKDVGFDIDVDTTVPIDVMNDLAVGCFVNYKDLFYDDEGNLKQSGVTKLTFDRKYEEHRFILAMDNVSQECTIIPEVTIKKFSAQLDSNNMVNLHFQVQCHPSDEALLFLRHAQVKDSVLVTIEEPAQQDLLEDKDED